MSKSYFRYFLGTVILKAVYTYGLANLDRPKEALSEPVHPVDLADWVASCSYTMESNFSKCLAISLGPHVLSRAVHTHMSSWSPTCLWKACFSRSLSLTPCTVTRWNFHSVNSQSSSLWMSLKLRPSSADVSGQGSMVHLPWHISATMVMDHLQLWVATQDT